MDERAQHNWMPRTRRVRPVHGRHRASEVSRHFFNHDEFSVDCVREGDREVVAARGQLVATSAWQLERELRRAEATDAFEILLDLAGLKFIDASGSRS